jgi:hypothetical protein
MESNDIPNGPLIFKMLDVIDIIWYWYSRTPVSSTIKWIVVQSPSNSTFHLEIHSQNNYHSN